MNKPLEVGASLPLFEAKDFEGERIVKEDLLGAPFVIYFYPKDDTPGCTKEACQFRDKMPSFEDLDMLVVGVSPDSPESHQKFMEKYELNFPLISDESLSFARQCGITQLKAGSGESVIRTTFLCDEEGVIHWMESPVNLDGHVERVMQAIENAFS
jgi:peroxiredoxin Q/BCP